MTDPGDEVKMLLAAARADFEARLETKVCELQDLSARGAWGEVRRAAHRLRGSAATYGFSAIGAAAATMEDVLIAAEPSPSADAKRSFSSALDAACAEIARLAKGRG
jgi:HPt (histidine-containing phosphotransfer) domain-containing protein